VSYCSHKADLIIQLRMLNWGVELAQHSFGTNQCMTFYKPAGPFTSASQRCFAPTSAITPVEVYERCHRSSRLQVALEGIKASPGIFYTGPQTLKKLNSNLRVCLITVQ
jgi:hypothetical protein